MMTSVISQLMKLQKIYLSYLLSEYRNPGWTLVVFSISDSDSISKNEIVKGAGSSKVMGN